MSLTKNRHVRCDWCGKITGNRDGSYAKPDGSAGRIVQPEWERESGEVTGHDICDECERGACPACGSAAVVKVRPAEPGPDGWGGRCKDCGHEWAMPGGN